MANATIFFIIVLMFIGASPGSTGGGIKTTTAGLLTAAIWTLFRGREDVEIFQRRIDKSIIYKAFAMVFVASALVIFVTMMLAIHEPDKSFLALLFDVVSGFGTVGLTTGITPALSTPSKLWLVVTMFAGRVGPVTLALALALRQKRAMLQYPEGKVIIG